MRIGLTGAGTTADRLVEQAKRAEADGFTSRWYPSAAGGGDPLLAMALAGRATAAIELGTAVLVSYACHPVLQASRAHAVVSAIGAPGRFSLIVGDEDSVAAQIRALFEAGATDLWAAPFPVGDDPSASRARTRALLADLARN
jgi:alkanesulfonate monooxygenase SsuD/methylene tetrahydromethanopterin reductase-like flavin-dependent oxidoreductase (luciferase family)